MNSGKKDKNNLKEPEKKKSLLIKMIITKILKYDYIFNNYKLFSALQQIVLYNI